MQQDASGHHAHSADQPARPHHLRRERGQRGLRLHGAEEQHQSDYLRTIPAEPEANRYLRERAELRRVGESALVFQIQPELLVRV